jgi:VTC domain
MTNQTLFNVLKDFSTISLDQLNASMSLMERIEKKYLITLQDLWKIMKELKDNYFVLSIKNNSIFVYDNTYMDTDDFLFFHQHEKNLKSRVKVRTREYVDSNIAFFEFKQKDGDVIRKSRFDLPVTESKDINNEWKAFYQSMCNSLELPYIHANLKPKLRTLYKRITLCSKKNDERITIDFDIKLQDITSQNKELISLWPVAIIETKSSHKSCQSHTTLKKLKYKAARWCSKYCLGVVYSWLVSDTKHFKNTMKFIDQENKPIHKIAKKTSTKLSSFKKDIVKKTEKSIPAIKVPKTIKAKTIDTKAKKDLSIKTK